MGAKEGLSAARLEATIAEGKKPLLTREPGSVVPSGVLGGAPETDAILNISSQNEAHFWILLISHF